MMIAFRKTRSRNKPAAYPPLAQQPALSTPPGANPAELSSMPTTTAGTRALFPLYDVKQMPRPVTGAELVLFEHGCGMVEPDGIEPTTSCLQSTRSPS